MSKAVPYWSGRLAGPKEREPVEECDKPRKVPASLELDRGGREGPLISHDDRASVQFDFDRDCTSTH